MSQFKIITPLELAQRLANDALCVVDVRTDAEIAQGKIAQAQSMPLHLLPERLAELDPNATTIFCCRVGARSAQAAEFAVAHGFTDVYNLQGGMIAWAHAGLPVSV